MPNYITNKLVIKDHIVEVLNFLKNDTEAVDFNKIIPMPSSLDISDSSLGDEGMRLLLAKADPLFVTDVAIDDLQQKLIKWNQYDQSIDLGKQYLINIATTGYKTWYGWRCANWETKWNALDSVAIDNYVTFNTAWSGVVKLMEKLSTYFPNVVFEYSYADEDTGHNCGFGTILNGVASMTYPVEGSKEAYDLAFELRPQDKEYYVLKGGNYVFVEE